MATNKLDKLREVDTAWKSRSSKELDKLYEGDNIKQVTEDHRRKRMMEMKRKKDLSRSRRQRGRSGYAGGRSDGKRPVNFIQKYIQTKKKKKQCRASQGFR